MPHEDGDAYAPVTATLSLGGTTTLDIYTKNADGERAAKPKWRILQEPRSLLITSAGAYRNLLHGISELESDVNLEPSAISNWDLLGCQDDYISGVCERQERISLTCRDVIKVSRLGSRLFGNHK